MWSFSLPTDYIESSHHNIRKNYQLSTLIGKLFFAAALSMVKPYVEGIAQFIVKMGDWVIGEPFLGSACGLLGYELIVFYRLSI